MADVNDSHKFALQAEMKLNSRQKMRLFQGPIALLLVKYVAITTRLPLDLYFPKRLDMSQLEKEQSVTRQIIKDKNDIEKQLKRAAVDKQLHDLYESTQTQPPTAPELVTENLENESSKDAAYVTDVADIEIMRAQVKALEQVQTNLRADKTNLEETAIVLKFELEDIKSQLDIERKRAGGSTEVLGSLAAASQSAKSWWSRSQQQGANQTQTSTTLAAHSTSNIAAPAVVVTSSAPAPTVQTGSTRTGWWPRTVGSTASTNPSPVPSTTTSPSAAPVPLCQSLSTDALVDQPHHLDTKHLEKALKSAQEEIDRLKAELDTAKNAIAQHQLCVPVASNSTSTANIEELESRLKQSQDQIKQLETQLSVAHQSLTASNSICKTIETEYEKLKLDTQADKELREKMELIQKTELDQHHLSDSTEKISLLNDKSTKDAGNSVKDDAEAIEKHRAMIRDMETCLSDLKNEKSKITAELNQKHTQELEYLVASHKEEIETIRKQYELVASSTPSSDQTSTQLDVDEILKSAHDKHEQEITALKLAHELQNDEQDQQNATNALTARIAELESQLCASKIFETSTIADLTTKHKLELEQKQQAIDMEMNKHKLALQVLEQNHEATLKQTRSSLETCLHDQTQQFSALHQTSEKISELKAQISKHHDETAILIKQIDPLKKEIDTLHKQMSQNKEVNDTLIKSLQEQLTMVHDDRENYSKAEEAFKAQQKLKFIETELSTIKAESSKVVESLNAKVADLTKQMTSQYADSDRIKQEENTLTEKLHCLTEQQSELQSKYDILSQELEVARASNERSSKSLLERDEIHKKIKARNDELIHAEAVFKRSINRLEKERDEAISQATKLAACQAEQDALVQTHKAEDAAKSTNGSTITELQSKVAKLMQDNDIISKKLAETENEMKIVERKSAQLVKDIQKQLIKERKQREEDDTLGQLQNLSLKTSGSTILGTSASHGQLNESLQKNEVLNRRVRHAEDELKSASDRINSITNELDHKEKELGQKSKIIQQYILQDHASMLQPDTKLKPTHTFNMNILSSVTAMSKVDPAILANINLKMQKLLEELTGKCLKWKQHLRKNGITIS
ncbi:hypothetical protein BSLG_005841 [Batrachochytrium salamandrivorans]|nr:hypothetical protein BSLG_005841 [Batrachochytrium salamandrivorans]